MRVLVVEDELRMAALLKRGLQEDGYVVDIAATGTGATGVAAASAVADNRPRGGAVVTIELPLNLTTNWHEERSNDRCPQPTGPR